MIKYNNLRILGECITQIRSFLGSRIGTEEALYLYTSGPDLTSIMPCKYGKPNGNFTKFVTEDSLRCEHVREVFIKNKDVDTAALVVSKILITSLNFLDYKFLIVNNLIVKYKIKHKIHIDRNICNRCCSLCILPTISLSSRYSHKHSKSI